jgi:hypothetical protein
VTGDAGGDHFDLVAWKEGMVGDNEMDLRERMVREGGGILERVGQKRE